VAVMEREAYATGCRQLGHMMIQRMGAGTFFQVGDTSARQKNYRKFSWFELATVTSQPLKYRLLHGWSRSTASLGLIIRFILTEYNRSTLASLKFPSAFILADIIIALW